MPLGAVLVKPCGGVDGAATGALSVKKLHVPICLLFVDHDCKHPSNRVADALDTALVLGWQEGTATVLMSRRS